MKEPLNIKLFCLSLWKNATALICGYLTGVVIFASVYLLSNYVFTPGKDYEAKSGLYLTYADEVRLEDVYINDYTWQELAQSDICVDAVMKELPFEISRDELINSISVKPESDVRFVIIKAKTKDPEKSVAIAKAYENAVIAMADRMVDLKTVQVFQSAKEAKAVTFENRIGRVCIVGGIVGFVCAFLLVFLKFVYDDSVYLPEQTKNRYGIYTLLCLTKKGSVLSDWDKNAGKNNFEEVLKDKKTVACTDISAEKGCEKEALSRRLEGMADLWPEGREIYAVDGLNQNADVISELKNADGVLLFIRSGAKNGKLIGRAADYLNLHQIPVLGIVLYDTSEKWTLRYFSDKRPKE